MAREAGFQVLDYGVCIVQSPQLAS